MEGKLVSQTKVKSSGDVFHELFRHKPHHISNISPHNIQNCDLHEGDWGTVGSIIVWNYVHVGKDEVVKHIIEAIDEENKSITFKLIEGDILDVYNSFKATLHVDTKGEDNFVTWSFEYVKPHEGVEDPHTLMEFLINVTKDIESHHLKQ